jgi:hypothetical protein
MRRRCCALRLRFRMPQSAVRATAQGQVEENHPYAASDPNSFRRDCVRPIEAGNNAVPARRRTGRAFARPVPGIDRS